MPPQQVNSAPVQPQPPQSVSFWKQKVFWIPLLILGLFILFVLCSHWYVVTHPELIPQQTASSGDNSVSASESNQYKTITNAALGVSFDVPTDWTIEDHLKDAGQLWILDPKSLGDGVDGHSFSFDVSTSSSYFSSLLSPNTGDHFAQLQALVDGKVIKAPVKQYGPDSLPGEEFMKVGNLTLAGYPAIHFHIIDGVSKEWGTRDMQDGYWVRVGANNVFLYFSSIDVAKKYTYETEAPTMQYVFGSIHISPPTDLPSAGPLK